MARVSFSEENRGKVVSFDFPKFRLKNGEKARVIVGLEDPYMEYVHTLRKPVIAEGRPVTEQVQRRDGSFVTEYKKDFVGTPICLGDEGILAEAGMDPKHCPACKLAKENPDYTEPPKRRFAMHVLRYTTKAGTFTPSSPFSVNIFVWAFGDMVFNKILDAKEEWGDIRKHDFLMGPCTNEGFQKYDINVGAEAAWLQSDETKRIVAETFKNNQIPDLSIAVGRQVQASWMKQDIDGIVEAWRIATGAGEAGGSSASLDEDLNDLLNADGSQSRWATSEDAATSTEDASDDDSGEEPSALTSAAKAAEESTDAPDGDDMFGDLLASSVGADESDDSEDEAEEAPEEAPAEKPKTSKKADAKKAEAPAEDDGVDNFDDLLAGV